MEEKIIEQFSELVNNETEKLPKIVNASFGDTMVNLANKNAEEKLKNGGSLGDIMKDVVTATSYQRVLENDENIDDLSKIDFDAIKAEKEAEKELALVTKELADKQAEINRLKKQQDINKAESDKTLAEQDNYFNDHKKVLEFAGIKDKHDINYMKFVYWISIPFYTIFQFINMTTVLISKLIGLVDVFFSGAFGKEDKIIYDNEGNEVGKQFKLNLVTRIILGITSVAIIAFVLLALLNMFTGIDVIDITRKYFIKIK